MVEMYVLMGSPVRAPVCPCARDMSASCNGVQVPARVQTRHVSRQD